MRAAESAPLLDEARARGAERCARGQRAALDEVEDDARAVAELGLGRKRVIQCRFNVAVPRGRAQETSFMLRDHSER